MKTEREADKSLKETVYKTNVTFHIIISLSCFSSYVCQWTRLCVRCVIFHILSLWKPSHILSSCKLMYSQTSVCFICVSIPYSTKPTSDWYLRMCFYYCMCSTSMVYVILLCVVCHYAKHTRVPCDRMLLRYEPGLVPSLGTVWQNPWRPLLFFVPSHTYITMNHTPVTRHSLCMSVVELSMENTFVHKS